MSQTYRLWQNAWRDDPLASVTLELPDDWTVTEYRMPADDHRPLTGEELAARIRNPVGMPGAGRQRPGGRGGVRRPEPRHAGGHAGAAGH